MIRKSLLQTGLSVLLIATAGVNCAVAEEASPPVALVPITPLPMRTEEPIVYATPIKTMVILEFKLYDNKTWCRLYIEKAVWEVIRANNGELPEDSDKGQLQCEHR